MVSQINQPVEVMAACKLSGNKLIPRIMTWNNRIYKFTRLGFHHPTTQGKRMLHVFTLTDENLTFRLEFDAESLLWTLREISDGAP